MSSCGPGYKERVPGIFYDSCTVYPGPCRAVCLGNFLQVCSLEECSQPEKLLFLIFLYHFMPCTQTLTHVLVCQPLLLSYTQPKNTSPFYLPF